MRKLGGIALACHLVGCTTTGSPPASTYIPPATNYSPPTSPTEFARSPLSLGPNQQPFSERVRLLLDDPLVTSATKVAVKCSVELAVIFAATNSDAADSIARAAYDRCNGDWERVVSALVIAQYKYEINISAKDYRDINRKNYIPGISNAVIEMRAKAALSPPSQTAPRTTPPDTPTPKARGMEI
ncbi:MAG TPA: hypothetical protein VNQ99_16195 [Xanthobacteraceae bacterium]|nr:hypothetical protein [Xanthobacteraceae bacterium]